MTIQRSLSNGRFSPSHDEIPHAPHRMASLEFQAKGSEYYSDGSVASSSSTIGSEEDEFSVNADLLDDDDDPCWSCYEDDLKEDGSVEDSLGQGEDHEEDEEDEQNFSYLYGHMSEEDSSILSEDDLYLDTKHIKEVEQIADDFGVMKLPEDKKPDVVDYGYGDAAPDSDTRQQQAVDYGYGDAAPDTDRQQPSVAQPKFGRRSSLKGMNGSYDKRRASLCAGQGDEIEVQIPWNKTIKRRRSITFNEEVDVNHIEKVTSMDGKKEELWFQKQEFKDITIGAYREVDKVKKGYKNIDIRGLENMVHQERTDKRVDKALDLVLDEQDIQCDNDRFDDTAIADLYTLSAVDSKIDARIQARRDAREVEDYLRETRKAMGAMHRRMSM